MIYKIVIARTEQVTVETTIEVESPNLGHALRKVERDLKNLKYDELLDDKGVITDAETLERTCRQEAL